MAAASKEDDEEAFMTCGLVLWLQERKGLPPLSYLDIVYGSKLNVLLQETDPAATPNGIGVLPGQDSWYERLENWSVLIQNINDYYVHHLGKIITFAMPDIQTIAKRPMSAEARTEVEKVLLLILYITLNCDDQNDKTQNKEQLQLLVNGNEKKFCPVIERIQSFETNDLVPLDCNGMDSSTVSVGLQHLSVERDVYYKQINKLSSRVDELESEVKQNRNRDRSFFTPPRSESLSPEKTDSQELAEAKTKIRNMQDQIDVLEAELRDWQQRSQEDQARIRELNRQRAEFIKSKEEVSNIRDDADSYQDKAREVVRLERVVETHQKRIHQLSYFEEMYKQQQEDMRILRDNNVTLNARVEEYEGLIETVEELKSQVENLTADRDDYKLSYDETMTLYEELKEENHQLTYENRSNLTESANLGEELNSMRLSSSLGGPSISLSDEVSQFENRRVLELENENQKLKKRLQETVDKPMVANMTKLMQLEQTATKVSREKKELEEHLETMKERSAQQIKELESEKEQLEEIVALLREGNEHTHKDSERENKKLAESVKALTHQVSEHRQLQKSHEQLKLKAQHLEHLQEENQVLEQTNVELEKEVTVLKASCDDYDRLEEQYLALELERDRLAKGMDRLKQANARLESIEQENTTYKVECQRLKRVVENMKNSTSVIADLEQDKESLNRELQQLRKALDGTALDRSKQEQLEVDLIELDADNQNLKRKVEVLTRRVTELEQDNTDLDTHTDSLQKTIGELRISLRKTEDIQKTNQELENDVSRLAKEKAVLEKEQKKVKQAYESCRVEIEDATSKMSMMDRENKMLKRQAAQSKDTNVRVQALEQEKAAIAEQASSDRKALNKLHEELVQSKIHAQDVTNEVEQLRNELQRTTIGSERQQAATDSRKALQTLEHRLEGGLKQTLALKEEKITGLESRLEAARKHNLKVQEELKKVREDYEEVVQQNEEIVQASLSGKPSAAMRRGSSAEATKELLELKDHVITLERANASFEKEIKYLKSSNDSNKLQLANVQVENSKFQSQISSLQTQNNMMHSQCGNLEVEKRSLHAEKQTLLAELQMREKQLRETEEEHNEIKRQHMGHQHQQNELVSDNEQLTKLNEQLASEYEALISEHGSLKANYKAMKAENRQAHDKLQFMAREKETVSQLKEMLMRDKESLRTDSQLRLDYVRLREELMQTQHSREQLRNENRSMEEENRSLRNDNAQLKKDKAILSEQLTKAREEISRLMMEIAELRSQLKNSAVLIHKLEEEKYMLVQQSNNLLDQNVEFMKRHMDGNEQQKEDHMAYVERLAKHRIEKERLQQMVDAYNNKKKNKGFFDALKQHFKGNRSKSTTRLNEELPEVYRSFRDQEEEMSNLTGRSKQLAKSTNAINMMHDMNGGSGAGSLKLRAAKSTDDLAFDSDTVGSSPRLSHTEADTEWSQTTIKSRQLLNNSGSASSSSTAPAFRGPRMEGRSAYIGDDSAMSLAEILDEMQQKSPQLMKAELKEQEQLEAKTRRRSNTPKPESMETLVLSPELGPRSATTESSTDMSRYKAKSEMNLSKLSSNSSLEFSDRYSPMNSTPMNPRLEASRNGSIGLSTPPQPLSYPSPVKGLSQQSSLDSYPGNNGNSNSMPRQNSSSSNSSGIGGGIGGYNAMTRTTTNNMVRSHTLGSIGGGANQSGSGVNNNNGLSSSQGQGQRQFQGDRDRDRYDPRVNPLPSRNNPPPVMRQSSTPGGAHYNHQQQQQHQQQQHPSEPPPYTPPPPAPSQQHQQQQLPQPQNESTYNPGNVRNLVQNYQISMNNTVSTNNSVVSSPQGVNNNNTVTPQRRMRPMSAGPLRSSSNSAFSVPQPSNNSYAPNSYGPNSFAPERNTGRALPRRPEGLTTGRTLPRTPDDARSPNGPIVPSKAPLQPPRPHSQGPPKDGPPKKNATWYEYGCV